MHSGSSLASIYIYGIISQKQVICVICVNINIITTLLIINSSVAEISWSDYIILHKSVNWEKLTLFNI